jgi:hypothetical protein
MAQDQWQVVDQVSGSALAEMLKGLLEAQGIEVLLSQEGIGESIYPVSVGPLSEIQLLVPAGQLTEAQKILAEYNAGAFEDLDYEPFDDEVSDGE